MVDDDDFSCGTWLLCQLKHPLGLSSHLLTSTPALLSVVALKGWGPWVCMWFKSAKWCWGHARFNHSLVKGAFDTLFWVVAGGGIIRLMLLPKWHLAKFLLHPDSAVSLLFHSFIMHLSVEHFNVSIKQSLSLHCVFHMTVFPPNGIMWFTLFNNS